jgi:membrane protein DedA with SNARE-associated domain
MRLLASIEGALRSLAHHIPIELFVILGSFVEEVLSPIPSPVIMFTSGVIAAEQGAGQLSLLWLAFLSSIGKTAGCAIIYVVIDKLEDKVMPTIGRYFGVTHAHVETIGRKLDRGPWGIITLTCLRAIPIVPSLPLNVACGIIRFPFKHFIVATFLGSVARGWMLLYVGHAGLTSYDEVTTGTARAESLMTKGVAVAILALIAWAYVKRHQAEKRGNG